jgi:hypothetical protein
VSTPDSPAPVPPAQAGAGPAPRRYSDDEVSRILRRAAELESAAASETAAAGTSLAELEEVAREAGLDPIPPGRAASAASSP